jgi:hypothetical protein
VPATLRLTIVYHALHRPAAPRVLFSPLLSSLLLIRHSPYTHKQSSSAAPRNQRLASLFFSLLCSVALTTSSRLALETTRRCSCFVGRGATFQPTLVSPVRLTRRLCARCFVCTRCSRRLIVLHGAFARRVRAEPSFQSSCAAGRAPVSNRFLSSASTNYSLVR